QPEQQRIMVYFIEEAKEHLNTIEHGLLNLQTVVADPESLNEVFRAAHSVKGGAAMLGIHSMQHISHRLEDYFKVLKEHELPVDRKLESLLFKSFDALHILTEELEQSFSLSDELSEKTLLEIEPVFSEINSHLTQIAGPNIDLSGLLSDSPPPTPQKAPAPEPEIVLDERCIEIFQKDILQQLREILGLFKQPDTPENRQALTNVCQNLAQVGQEFQLKGWSELLDVAGAVVAYPENSFATLASVVVPNIKEARDLVLAKRAADVKPMPELLDLMPALDFGDLGGVASEASASDDWLDLFSEESANSAASVGDTDSFLDDLFKEPANPDAAANADVALPMATASAEDNLASLDTLLAETPTPAVPTAKASSPTEDFSDLEKLLEEPKRPADRNAKPKQKRAGTKSHRRSSAVSQTMKVPVKQLDNLGNLIGELVVSRNSLEDSQNRLRQFLDNLLLQVQQLNDLGRNMEDLYERSLLENSLLTSRQQQLVAGGNGSGSSGSHSTGEQFDALEMDSFTGFHTLSQEMIERIVRVREAASDIEFIVEGTEQVTRMFRQITTQVQEGLTKSRMVPFSQVAERLPRAVRDISMKCGKKARLELEGRDTLIDKSILERLYDPLTHLVNNALFHGIEAPDVRQSLGKAEEGVIKLRAFYQGNQAIISITDDGAGIDVDRVKTKAVEKNLLTREEADSLSRQEAYALLFKSGFSTQDQANDLAGRGVGMDVVRNSIHEIRGVINTDSGIGKGTTFTIRLPLTLSITKALCCIDNSAQIAFPIDGVQDVIDIPKNQLQKETDGQVWVTWQDKKLPCKPLGELLAYSRRFKRNSSYSGNNTQDDGMASVVILRSADDLVAIGVEQVLAEQEIVIKQLSGPVPKPMGVAGVTVLGDGGIMAIADVMEIVDLCLDRLEVNNNLWKSILENTEIEEDTDPMVLIVDDSITVRELLSMTFNKVGYRVEQARDGQEAWEKLRSGLPCDLVFCDVEMPRMDGLELLSRLQQDDDLQDLPVAMLTSRGAARHKQMATELGARGYFTKPYLEEVLLDAAQRMLNGEVLVK
ncbi:hybrid sensor histidine kinase/response regulator, partial [Acaryochloris sp. IP29b_bin.137]|uniref:hybrid sensor histidine kinase/response regulator n=1 Tax=Acaryochloris sp. IP29b_bin.137 TaxID=2969217 RepID=UPI00344BCD4F